MLTRPWDIFFKERMQRILGDKHKILDIGGGLRISTDRSNREDRKNHWIGEEIKQRGIEYRVLDYVDTYHPDLVGDIQDLPLEDESEQAIICNAILEHVENPFKASAELYRVLEKGGYCFVYVPFLYYYHAEKGYYGDYWRYTEDTIRMLFKPFRTIEIQRVRGALETLTRLSPLGRWSMFSNVAFILDTFFGKLNSKQTSGYFIFLVK